MNGISEWKKVVRFLWNHFLISDLLKTFFVPWHKEEETSTRYAWFERFAFNTLTRLIGAVIRLALILIGTTCILFSVIFLPFFILFNLKVSEERMRKDRPLGTSLAYGFTPFLNRVGHDLELGPEPFLVGKDKALTQAMRILSRSGQNNMLLLGDPGVGRTTFLRGLAERLSYGDSLEQIEFKKIYEIPQDSLSPENLRNALNEASEAGNIILSFDNFHAFPELLDILLPFLEANAVQVIGVSDRTGYHGSLKGRKDVLRFFEIVELEEPNTDEVVSLLGAHIDAKGISADRETLQEIVILTNRLIHTTPQPEKSLDVLEELLVAGKSEISLEDVHTLLSEKTGVPLGEVSTDEREKLLNLGEILREEIIGQEEAIKTLEDTLQRSRAGLVDTKRPVGSFLFLGPTGVGKTHTAKILAHEYFGSENSIIRFDMSEFRELETISIFSKRLAEALMDNPFSLLLIDEIEKAHPDILNLFLQGFDEGHITDEKGNTAHLQNALIICTSNAGSDLLMQDPTLSKNSLIEHVIGNGLFRPELVNRFSAVVLFKPLNEKDAVTVTELLLRDLEYRMKERKVTLEYETGFAEKLVETSFDTQFGARSIRRAIEEKVEGYIARYILEKGISLSEGAHILIPLSVL